MSLADCNAALQAAGVLFVEGLHEREFEAAEKHFGFRFTTDLQQFLAMGLPQRFNLCGTSSSGLG
jgi:hypothetical protein